MAGFCEEVGLTPLASFWKFVCFKVFRKVCGTFFFWEGMFLGAASVQKMVEKFIFGFHVSFFGGGVVGKWLFTISIPLKPVGFRILG